MTIYTRNNFTINIDLSRDSLLSEAGVAIMKDRYLLKEYNKETKTWVDLETSPQECFARAACSQGSNQEHAQRLYDYASRLWFMFATPILSNSGSNRGLPISCFVAKISDTRKGIADHIYENTFLSSYGGGIGGDWSSLRADGSPTSSGNISTGLIPFLKTIDAEVAAFMQGSARRGSYAAYLDISHPEIEEFIDIRNPFGSKDLNRRCLGVGFHHAVTIPDSFMQSVKDGSQWDLIDPHSKEVKKSVDARTLWMKILTTRMELGEPYLFFTDTANAALPQFLKDKGLRINSSQLCNEIMLPTAPDRTAVCCLSSVNLEFYDDWRDCELFIQDIVEMLDNVITNFCKEAPEEMWRAVYGATIERSIGLGAMGFHLYLQRKSVPFESPMTSGINRKVFGLIKDRAAAANKHLAKERGPCQEALDAGITDVRLSHLLACAPNANIATICGNTSPSIEPFNSNFYKAQTLSGSFQMKNKELDRLFKEVYCLDIEDYENAWQYIAVNQGSVQGLDFLSKIHKDLFKTAFELDQNWIIDHASSRQDFICQGQSLNLFLRPDIHKNELHKLHFSAWERGLKGLYYCRSKPMRESNKSGGKTLIDQMIEAANDLVEMERMEEVEDREVHDFDKELSSAELTFDPNDDRECLSCQG